VSVAGAHATCSPAALLGPVWDSTAVSYSLHHLDSGVLLLQ